MGIKVGVIGPTDLQELGRVLRQPEEFLLTRAAVVGRLIAERGCDLWVNSDGGMLAAVARAYKGHGGRRLVMLYPWKPIPWPIAHAEEYVKIADEVIRPNDWFDANYAVVSEPEVCVCMGLSPGTQGELSYIRWDEKFQTGNLKMLVVIRELLQEGRLPSMFAQRLRPLLQYVATAEGLEQALQQVNCVKEPIPVL